MKKFLNSFLSKCSTDKTDVQQFSKSCFQFHFPSREIGEVSLSLTAPFIKIVIIGRMVEWYLGLIENSCIIRCPPPLPETQGQLLIHGNENLSVVSLVHSPVPNTDLCSHASRHVPDIVLLSASSCQDRLLGFMATLIVPLFK